MAKTVCKLLGLVFLIVGIAGIFSHNLLGAHLNMAHNMVHIVSGVIALYFGFSGSYSGARGFSRKLHGSPDKQEQGRRG